MASDSGRNHPQQFQEPDHHHQQQQNNQDNIFGITQPSSSSYNFHSNFMIREDEALDELDLLDSTILFEMVRQQSPLQIQDQRQNSTMTTPPTLSMFPSQPMHVQQPPSTQLQSEGNHEGCITMSGHESPERLDSKRLRRLARNREAAKRARQRKKSYVQQLETSKIKLLEVEQQLKLARAQGFHIGESTHSGGNQGPTVVTGDVSPDAAVFHMEYGKWLEEHNKLVQELQTAMEEHVEESKLAIYVDNCFSHYNEVLHLKRLMAKSDVLHLVSGMWRTPLERCFAWIGGFRPSQLIEIILNQIKPLTGQQFVSIYQLQQLTRQIEETLNQEMEKLKHSIFETISDDGLSNSLAITNHMNQMVMAVNKLCSVEGLITQADHLRRTTLHRLHQFLTTHQMARCLLAAFEYFHRLRTLSSLWLTHPRQA